LAWEDETRVQVRRPKQVDTTRQPQLSPVPFVRFLPEARTCELSSEGVCIGDPLRLCDISVGHFVGQNVPGPNGRYLDESTPRRTKVSGLGTKDRIKKDVAGWRGPKPDGGNRTHNPLFGFEPRHPGCVTTHLRRTNVAQENAKRRKPMPKNEGDLRTFKAVSTVSRLSSSPCQGEGRRFESGRPLQKSSPI
jgi:hypothetical protein